ncbi:MAG: UDP-N-acetylmuramyl-tripeptide synthetase [Treponema sp.]|nr:UDP-N-acetylmuramyl-tripeptide synthetase [Treponema sp.]
MKKMLSQLLPAFPHTCVAADGTTPLDDADARNIPVTALEFDSRAVTDGTLFFALPGLHEHGNRYIPEALMRGATAIVFQGELSHETQIAAAEAVARRTLSDLASATATPVVPAFIKVSDARFAMAPIADAFYDSPSQRLIVIGVTGTEGKSSTVSFIWQLLRACGKKAGFISTVAYSLGGDAIPNPEHQTTPEAPIIQYMLNALLENGCTYAVIETSSHGLSTQTNRLGNVLFDCAVCMNVTLEHLEFHKTFEQYRSDKANLFRALDRHDHCKLIAGTNVRVPAVGIVNLEDAAAQYFIESTTHPVYGFTTDGMAGAAAAETGDSATPLPPIPGGIRYMKARNIAAARYGLTCTIDAHSPDAVFRTTDDPAVPQEHTILQVTAPLPGAFNVYNLMAALIAVSSVTELPFADIAQHIPELMPVPGRMTVIDAGQPFEVIVDYAHTPSSFETILPPIRKRCAGKLFAVFGSGGERDVTKRPLQGAIAARFCDIVVLTDEDPRGEDPLEIIQMITEGAEEAGKKRDTDLFLIPDRKQAIRTAFRMAHDDDIVLLLGKAHENSIIYSDRVLPYDETAEAQSALFELGFSQGH